MSRLSYRIATVAALAVPLLASHAVAQEQTADEAQITTEGLALGAEVDDKPKPGDTYIKGEFGDWSMRCIVVEEGEEPCQMYQLLADQSGSPISEFTMFRLPDGGQAAAGATIIVPLGTSLQQGLVIKVDDEPARNYPYSFCDQIGCYARIGLTADDVEIYKRGAEAELTISPIAAPDQRVAVTLSLVGFTAAFEASSVLEQ